MSILDSVGNTPLVELTKVNPNPKVRLMAKLEGANLRYALLTRANLTGANLSKVEFGGAQLNKVNLTRANLKDAHITYRQLASVSTLDGATMPDGRLFDGNLEPYVTE